MAYDVQQLTAAPRHVVLSSCDVGRTVVRPGEEILGFTAALLYIGTATVTASVTRVGDAAAVETMAAYHRLLAAGTSRAEALAAATAGAGSARSSASAPAERLLAQCTYSEGAVFLASVRCFVTLRSCSGN